jgi:CBS domain-containing protein
MRVGEICIRDMIHVERTTSVLEAARLMRTHHVGNVIVVERESRGLRPVGIVTDRDIVVQVIGAGLDPVRLSAGDLMSHDLITAPEEQGIFETIEQMQHSGVRRLPITDHSGHLMGIVTVDDLLELLSIQLSSLSKVTTHERKQERAARA